MRTSKTIKDPTFNIYRRGGSVEKAMESKGDGKAKKELMQLAKDEKDILFDVDYPFLAGMDFCFNSEKRIYFVMPFIKGGELFKIVQS